MATSQLWRTTRGASARDIHSFRWGSTSGVPIPPRASAASWRTISDSAESSNTRRSAGTEWGERSCPKTNAISCLGMVNTGTTVYREGPHLNKALSSENPAARASTAAGVPTFRSANIARYRSNNDSRVSNKRSFKAEIPASETSSGFGVPASSPDDGGAGSIEV
jgi:hypothetical protein